MVATTRDKLLTADAAARLLNISLASLWRAVAADRLPNPVYPAARAPRWYQSELLAAVEKTRAMPREAMAERRRAKLQNAAEKPKPPVSALTTDAPGVLPARVRRAMTIMGIEELSELRLDLIEKLEAAIHHPSSAPELRNGYWKGSGKGINLGQTTCDMLRQIIGAPTMKDAKRRNREARAAAIESSLQALVDWHRNTKSLAYPDMTRFVEFDDAVIALQSAPPHKAKMCEDALKAVLRHNNQWHLNDCWRDAALIRKATHALNWKNWPVSA
jgi:predicted DNA-binding transcriptional regulator AlpA